MEKVLLNMKAISKTFGSVQALKEVSLDLYAGEVLALMGENGAGKSTLMNILSGSLQPTKGEIYLKGEKVTVPGPIAAKKLGISKIHQELQIVPEMSVAENIFLGRWMKKKGGSVDFKTMAAEARKYLEMLDVHVDPATKLKDLRIGEQQLVEIAKAISLNSETIIMDEPTSAISEKEAEKLFTIIRKLRSEGKGIIYITHRMEEIFQIADRLTVMRDGTYIGTVKASETSKDEIIKMMVGRDMSEQYPKDPTEKGEIALKVENLTYTPPAGSFRRSLKNISLHVRHGEVLGIAGLAGAGRSELFECLAGVHYKDTTAKISIDGKEVTIKNPADAIKAGISFATEDRKGTGLVLQRSIGENMSLPLLKKFSPAFFMKSGEEKKEWNKQMETLRVKAPGTKTLASALSGGNQQKVVLGRWLMTEPKILLLDEPTRGIDVGAKAEIYQLINNLAKQGMAIIVVSSELPEVIGISDRIVTFCEGELTGEYLHNFLDIRNLMNVLRAVSENGIIAIGMTIILILGDIDLSVGSVVGLISTGCAYLMVKSGLGFVPAILVSLGIGALFGLFNGLCITKLRLQAFIVTLASMNIARGLARFWANGIGIPLAYGKGEGMAPPAFEVLQMRLWGIVPVPAIIFIVLLIVFQIILSKTRFGRQVYAIGGNKNAAYLSGIKVDRIKIYAFMICAMLSSVAAMIHAAQISQGGPNEGQGYELNAVAACAIGGTSLAGGKGTVFGTLIGALILGMLDNVLGLKGVNSNLQLMVKGFLIIIAVFMQADKVND